MDNGEAWPVLVLVIGWGFIGTGLFARRRRPENSVGTLMTAVGFASLLVSLGDSDAPLLHTIGLFTGALANGIGVHLLLAFPSGKVETRGGRAVVAAGYVMATLLQPLPFFFAPNTEPNCWEALHGRTVPTTAADCPSNLVLLEPNEGLAEALFAVRDLVVVGLGLVVCAILLQRWRHALRPQRRALAPVLWSGVVGGATVALAAATQGASDAVLEVIDWAFVGVFASVPFAFLAGLLRSRLYRGDATSSLVQRLGEAHGDGDVRGALADALGEPTLALAYWLPDSGRYVDASGQPVELPGGNPQRAATEIEFEGRRIAAIVHDPSLADEPELVRTAGAAAALALERQRLEAELRARIEELRASREQILRAREEERRRLWRDLHDEVGTPLAGVVLRLGAERARLLGGTPPPRQLLSDLEGELRELTVEVRQLVDDLRPPALDELGLVGALRKQAARLSGDGGPLVRVKESLDGAEQLPAAVEVAAYRVATEAMANVVKHADASCCAVQVIQTRHALELEVVDNGAGLPANPREGVRLAAMRERAAEVGGSCVCAPGPDGGTRISCYLPLARR